MKILARTKKNVGAYSMALKNACKDLKAAREAKNENKKSNSVLDELDNTLMKYSLPPGIRKECV